MDLEQWLTAHGLEEHLEVFVANRIEVDLLEHLTENDLNKMGLPVGSVRRFLVAIQAQQQGSSAPASEQQPVAEPQPAQTVLPASQPAVPQPASPPVQATHPAIQQAPAATPHLNPPASSRQQTRHQPKAKNSRKATAIMIAVGVHVAIILLATTLTIFAASKDEPEIIATIAPPAATPQQEMKKKTVQKQTKNMPSAASAAAAPMAIMMKANAEARYTTPDVTRTSTGPLGMGEGDLGAGAFGIGTGLEGSSSGAMTMFGGTGGRGLKGTFYDMKQNQQGKPNPQPNYNGAIFAYGRSGFDPGTVAKYFKAPRQLTFTSLVVPRVNALEGPKAFEVEDKVKPSWWFVHYTGRVKAPKPGRWRFAGGFDNHLSVYVNDELVFNGIYMRASQTLDQAFSKKGFLLGLPVSYGKWIDLSKSFKLDIIIGEGNGGAMGGAVLIQHEQDTYKMEDGTPILPLFAIGGEPHPSILKRAATYPYPIAKKGPVFQFLR